MMMGVTLVAGATTARLVNQPDDFKLLGGGIPHAVSSPSAATLNRMVRPVLPPHSGALSTGGSEMIHNKPCGAAVYGIDLGKNIFHVVGTNGAGNIVQRILSSAEKCRRVARRMRLIVLLP